MIEITGKIQEITTKTPEIEEEEILETKVITRTVMSVLAKEEKIEAPPEIKVNQKIEAAEKEIEAEIIKDMVLIVVMLIGMILVMVLPEKVTVSAMSKVTKIDNRDAKGMLQVKHHQQVPSIRIDT